MASERCRQIEGSCQLWRSIFQTCYTLCCARPWRCEEHSPVGGESVRKSQVKARHVGACSQSLANCALSRNSRGCFEPLQSAILHCRSGFDASEFTETAHIRVAFPYDFNGEVKNDPKQQLAL